MEEIILIFMQLAGRFIDPAASFALWMSNLALEYNNFSLVMSLWTDKVPTYGWVLIAWVVFGAISLVEVSVYGEIEFWFAASKVIFIFVGFLLAILLNTGAIGGQYIGFHYWSDPGTFVNGFNGFGKAFVLAAAYYTGSEVVALTGSESQSPTKHMAKAIRLSVVRIFVIFVGMMFFTTLLVPYDDPAFQLGTSKAGKSPWTIALNRAGWSGAQNLINVFILTGMMSLSVLYISSRVLVGLALSHRAPSFFAKTTKKGVPVRAIIFCNFFGLLAILNQFSGAASVFTYVTSLSGSATFIVWASIGITHIRFRRAYAKQGFSPKDLPFRATLFPYGAYFVAIFNIILVIISGYTAFLKPFNVATFITSYVVIVIFLVLYVGWKLIKKTTWVKLEDMDLITGRAHYDNPNDDGPGLFNTCWVQGLRGVSHICSYFRSPAQTTGR
ncbi:unnamed protein product [Clonostachys rhizophaga]|uniref:Amino acid permease/ SLC12A domain-containing protein n=1 Tax=Clonostachys rhizophaga TaxID=160324 RepID=A0A9N9YAV7_9HYPO|nr:unnamed protein product [Clonostachys rhizophaga]